MARGIEIKGIERLEKALKKHATLEDVKKVVRYHGAQLQQEMQRSAVFTRGYSTGATKQSIKLDIKDRGLAAWIGPTTDYSVYVEYGTRFMSAQPFVRPSLNREKHAFIRSMRKLRKY